ncbi:hypothetical protein INT47_009395 [Mucor saturninus]|uniref:Coth-domain-containing protein n=1 Tax=Mucor saturninus TaxID=64648 RepID=A0A8H7V5P3_9FUNG|nr:hypothetical protein INT47_009395 [Mucor saturninus]
MPLILARLVIDSDIILALVFVWTFHISNAKNITYSLIAAPFSADQSLAVVIDNTTWPLYETYGIIYQGKAPIATTGYYYAILENDKQPNVTEAFHRTPSQNDTVNEFFNRTSEYHQVLSLPQMLPPLPSINRIDTNLHIQGQIPTIHIWGNASAVKYLHEKPLEDISVRLNFTYIGLHNVQTFEDVKVSLAGRSSRYLPKLSYVLKIKNKSENNLFGFKNFKLRALGMDPSYIREYVTYSVIKSVGLPASGFSYVRLFINNKPVGFYGLIETFQDPWLANEFAYGDKDYQSGFLYQGITIKENQTIPVLSDLSYSSNISHYSAGEYKIKAGPEENSDADYTDLQKFTKFVFEANSSTDSSQWNKHIDCDGFIRSMVLENLLGFSDAYMTLANNYYLYNNPKSDGQMIFISSDLDTSLGISLFDMTMMISGNYTEHPGFTFQPLTKKFFSHEAFSTSYQRMFMNLTQILINPTIMNPFIDSIVEMIRPDVEWDDKLERIGEFNIPPVGGGQNSSDGDGLGLDMFPPGLRSDWSDVPQTFDSAINGPTNSSTMESVKGFILRKSSAILDFYGNNSFNK